MHAYVKSGGRILVIEDEEIVQKELKILLENAGYEVKALDSFEDIILQIEKEEPDLVLLDVNLPGCSGFEVCTQLRERTRVPVIFLTGRADAMDELTGILKGGDDYITKPYQAPILLARIAAVLKRTMGADGKDRTLLTRKGVRLDVAGCTLSYMGRDAELTKSEMKTLHRLYLQPGEYVSRMDLVEYLWEQKVFVDDNTLSVYITRIREKLRSIGVEDFVETKRGMGYRV